ncbi:uncharacterized protein LOC6556649 [Drosophila grimshawi]|uniref:GH15122 n=1 Tax=Drosophila grimshawi TaxID=7222 RepID=B4IYP2_DROGR|nr:uncharacterized protein LOC6556649 [Drosophila grimshawi]EDV96579.1 GH15122 [Drosophila grimshawi]
METGNSSNHSVFDQITKLAVLLLQDELSEAEKTAAIAIVPPPASVARKRSQIYESVLRRQLAADLAKRPRFRTPRLPQCQKLLNELCANLEAELGADVGRCLQSICTSKDDQKSEENQGLKGDGVERQERKFRMLVPKPLRLEQSNGELQPPVFDLKYLRSVEQMRSSMQPIHFRRQTNYLPNNFDAMPKPSRNEKNIELNCSILNDSMARMKEHKMEKKRVKFNLPAQNKCKTFPPDIKANRMPKKPWSQLKKNFISDVNAGNELKWHRDHTLELYFIELPNLIDHLKYNAAGLQSTTFIRTDDGRFVLKPNTTLSNVQSEVLDEFVQPFLASGDAYRNLCDRTQWHGTLNHCERPLNRALRQAIIVFLANSRQFLLSVSANSLLQLLHITGPAMQMLQQLNKLFHDDFRMNIAKGINGAGLLSFVWSAIKMSVNSEYSQLLLYLLRSLAVTYYGQLERWIYQGELDEPFNELFINGCMPHSIHERSKEFFDRGYYLRPDAVPAFLVGCEQTILQCGKYNRLLQTYNAQHVVFKLKHLELVVCMSEEQLSEMTQKLEQHYKQLMQNIQNPFKMKSIVDEYTASSQRFGNRMWDCTQAHIADWKQRQKHLQLIADAAKQRRYDELNEQQEQQQQERLEQRRNELVIELAYQGQCDQLEEQRLQRHKQALQEQIAALEKVTIPLESTKVAISPDDSTSSNRSYLSCEEADSELLLKCKPNSETVLSKNQSEDVLNSNDNDNNNDDGDMARNRMRNLCSDQFQECYIQVKLNQGTTTTSASGYSDAKANRLRVLSCTDELTQRPPDMNMNLEELSDLQRNRQRMHQHNKFSSLNSDDDDGQGEREQRLLHSDTELEHRHPIRDDSKLIEASDNGLHLPLERHKLYVETAQDTSTPMSTTSDVEAEPFANAIPNEVVDAANNNNIKRRIHSDINHVNTDPPISSVSTGVTEPDTVTEGEVKPMFSLKPLAKPVQPTIAHDPFMIKRYMQLSVMVPLNAHLSLLRNEVLRIFQDLNVFEHFCQLRNYFFLLDGEFGTQLIASILQQIESGVAPHNLCNRGTLDSIVNNAIGNRMAEGTCAALVADNLELNSTHIPESFDLMSIDLLSIFQLTCKVDWPLNLVISVETMAKYGQIFSHLIKLRHVNYMLERAYRHLQQLSKLHGWSMQRSSHYRNLQMVRHKLAHFVITLQNHLETTVLQATWKSFTDELCAVDSIEGLYQRHVEYLKKIAFLSLLNRRSAKFRETIDSILVIALRFCKILHSKPFVLNEEQKFEHPRYKRLIFEEGEFEKFMRYAIYLGNKVAASGYQEQMVNLIRIINFNNYYTVSESTN